MKRYTLIVINQRGASEETKHATKASVREHIRTWAGKLTARVFNADGELLYEGSAKSFGRRMVA